MTSYLISYDISNNKLRTRLSKILLRHGCKRLQKSVFLVPNYSKQELTDLRIALKLAFQYKNKQNNDSLICLEVTETNLNELLWHGDKEKIEDILAKVWNLLI